QSLKTTHYDLLPIEEESKFIGAIYPPFESLIEKSESSSNLMLSPGSPSLLIPKDHLAFFCRVELHLEKAANIPIKFRLGSVDYVDRLEGKRDW
ncbi:MAG: hypothetical protein AAFQ92_29705, partial [Bacteroidota bacterium]